MKWFLSPCPITHGQGMDTCPKPSLLIPNNPIKNHADTIGSIQHMDTMASLHAHAPLALLHLVTRPLLEANQSLSSQPFLGHSYAAPTTPSIHTIKQLGFAVSKEFDILIRNAMSTFVFHPTPTGTAPPAIFNFHSYAFPEETTKGPLKERNQSNRALRMMVPPEHGKQKLGDATQHKRRSHTFIKNLLHLVLSTDTK
jgi:hypothetical protein